MVCPGHCRNLLQRDFLFLMFPLPAVPSVVSLFRKQHTARSKGIKQLPSAQVFQQKLVLYTHPTRSVTLHKTHQNQRSTSELHLFQPICCEFYYNSPDHKEQIDSPLTVPAVNLLNAFLYELKSGLRISIIKAFHN